VRRTNSFLLMVFGLAITSILMFGQAGQPPQGARGQGDRGGRGGGGGLGRGATAVAYDDYTGFTRLWDGQTFNGWDGETDVWSIQNGAIHADTTKTPGQHHIHYVGPGAIMKDFDFKVEVRISETGANGGIQYRSRLLHPAHSGSIENPMGKPLPPGITTLAQAIAAGVTTPPPPPPPDAAARGGRGGGGGAPNPWQVSGYQFDMDSNNNYTGGLYEGQGRGIVNLPGGIAELLPGRTNARIATVADNPAQFVKPHKGLDGEWNQFEIIARGNTLTHIVNGHVITVTIDDNPQDRAAQGILSLQLEGNGQIWYRNVYVKHLEK
jgi:hypothetical protein